MNLVRMYRESMGLSQKELADLLQMPGVDRETISKMESGYVEPTQEMLEALKNGCAQTCGKLLEVDSVTIPHSVDEILRASVPAALIYRACYRATEFRPVSRHELMETTGLSGRAVREIISQLRMAGARIGASSGNRGYWLCKDLDSYLRLRREYLCRIHTFASIVHAMDQCLPGQVEVSYGEI